MSLDELYQEVILDHFKNPRCRGELNAADAEGTAHNPLCGDQLKIFLKNKESVVNEASFMGQGCSISQAGASILCELLRGKSFGEIQSIGALYEAMIKGEEGDRDLSALGDAVALQGVRRFPARTKCALLSWEAIKKALENCKAPK